MKSDQVYVMHVMDAIERMESHLNGVSSLESFVENDLVFDATVRQLEIIGEASNNVSKLFQAEHPNVPWKDMLEQQTTIPQVSQSYFSFGNG